MNNEQLWQAALGEIELTLSRANFTTWFKDTFISSFENNQAVVCVPNTFTKAWLEKKYHQEVIKSLERVSGKPIKKLEYKIENIKNVLEQEVFMNATENTVANEPIFSLPSLPFLLIHNHIITHNTPTKTILHKNSNKIPMAGLFLTLNTVLIIL